MASRSQQTGSMGANFWFTSWSSLARIAVFSVLGYALLIALVRLYGKRTISKRNPSDFVVTVAIGSVLANWVMQSPVSLADGVFAIALWVTMQHVLEWVTTRSQSVRRLTEGRPTLLVYEGKPLPDNMRSENINESELLLSLRRSGYTAFDEVGAVVLEMDGTVTVLPNRGRPPEMLRDVEMRS